LCGVICSRGGDAVFGSRLRLLWLLTKELGRDGTLGQDGKAGFRVLADQAPGREMRSEPTIGDRGQQRAPDATLERGRYRGARIM
jgi:hypothetical protein